MMPAPAAPRRFGTLAAAFSAAWLTAPAAAHQEPLFEFGLGVGAVAFQDYRGSNTTHGFALPLPYFSYNGKFLKADREGVRGLLFNREWIELTVSGNATPPVRNDRARYGMPDLKSTLEIGPSLDVHLLRSEDKRIRFDLRMPLRAALTVQASPRYVGWTFSPRLALDVAEPLGLAGWQAGVLAGPLFAERRYHAYFYSVAPEYATLARPAYEAAGGYAGTQAVTAVSKRFPHFWMGAYLRYDTLAGAVFGDSPLVRRNGYWAAGLGISWMIHRSAQMVEVAD